MAVNDRCGTHLGYRDHIDAGTPTCAACRKAHAAVRQLYRRRRYLHRQPFMVPAVGTQRRLQALAAIGWSSLAIADRLGVTPQTLRRLHGQRQCWTATRDKIAALYDELSMTPGGNRRAATWAAKRGWSVPLSWDDDEIDDPAAVPHNPRNPHHGRARNRDLDERVMALTRAGLSAKEIALRLRTHQRQVVRIRTRNRNGEVA
jgi:hypothetical protein